MPLCYAAPDKVLGDPFLCGNKSHLVCYDATLGIGDNTHSLHIFLKDKIKARFSDSGLNFSCLENK
jgi:hypothetical protein